MEDEKVAKGEEEGECPGWWFSKCTLRLLEVKYPRPWRGTHKVLTLFTVNTQMLFSLFTVLRFAQMARKQWEVNCKAGAPNKAWNQSAPHTRDGTVQFHLRMSLVRD